LSSSFATWVSGVISSGSRFGFAACSFLALVVVATFFSVGGGAASSGPSSGGAGSARLTSGEIGRAVGIAAEATSVLRLGSGARTSGRTDSSGCGAVIVCGTTFGSFAATGCSFC